jgi:AraC family transcriptional regulator, ethanolamine operon transcriptional activator
MSNRSLKHISGKPVYVHHDVSSIEQLVKIFPQWDGTYEQLSCGKLRGTVRLARGHFIVAHAAQSNQSMQIRGIEKPQLCNFALVSGSASTCFWQRRRLNPQSLLVRNVDINHQSTRGSTNLSLAVSPENFHQAFRAVNQEDYRHVNWQSLELSPDVFQELLTLHQQLLSLVSDASNGVEIYLIEQAIMRVLAEALNPSRTTRVKEMPLSSRSKLVNRAEDLMRSSLNEPLGEIDLCTILGVSGRTLRTAFRERFGMGPIVYHQTLRLNAVRSKLMTGAASTFGVAGVAKEYGFNHPGKFAGYYRRQFGIVPSMVKNRLA